MYSSDDDFSIIDMLGMMNQVAFKKWTRQRDEEWSWQLKHAESMDRLSSWRKRTRLSSWDDDDFDDDDDDDDDDDADAGGSGGGGGGGGDADADADVDYCSIWLLSDVLD